MDKNKHLIGGLMQMIAGFSFLVCMQQILSNGNEWLMASLIIGGFILAIWGGILTKDTTTKDGK